MKATFSRARMKQVFASIREGLPIPPNTDECWSVNAIIETAAACWGAALTRCADDALEDTTWIDEANYLVSFASTFAVAAFFDRAFHDMTGDVECDYKKGDGSVEVCALPPPR